MTKYNWELAERQFTTGITNEEGQKSYPNKKEISETHKIPFGTVRSYASRNDWDGKKATFIDKKQRKIAEKKSEAEANTIVKSDLDFGNTGEEIRKLGVRQIRLMNDKLDIYERLIKEDPQHPEAWKFWVRGSESKNVSEQIQTGQNIVKVAQGENTVNIGVKVMDVDEEEKKLVAEFGNYLATKGRRVE